MSKEADQKKLSLLEHIDEFRKRLLWMVLALVVGSIICAFFAQRMMEWLAVPLGGVEQLQAIEVTENISVYMKIVLLGGVTLAMPVIIFQMWQFVAPGLYKKERRYVYLLVPLASLLFVAGILFTYYVSLPPALNFLLHFINIRTAIRPENYLSFVINILFWIGVSFETPLVMFFLAKVRVVNHRMLLKGWRVAVFVIAVLAAVITPTPDPVNMSLVMAPLVLLYGLSVFLAWIAYRPSKEEED